MLYASTGEKLDAFERFHPDRMSQRILGMGDVMTLIEKAEKQIDVRQAQELEKKLRQATSSRSRISSSSSSRSARWGRSPSCSR